MAPNDIAQHLHDIAQHLRRLPFIPLRIHLSNGDSYIMSEHWHAGLWLTELWLGVDPDEDGIPRRSTYADTRHVTPIEPLPNSHPSGGNGTRH